MHLLEVTCHEHPCLEVQYGGIGGFIAKKPPKRVDPMKVIQVCLDSLYHKNAYCLIGSFFFIHFVKLETDCSLFPLTVCTNFAFGFWQDYLDQHKLRLWDFFRNIDKDGTMRVPVADFRRAVQVTKLIHS